MNQITIEELSAYLPYGVKCKCMGLHIDDYSEPVIPLIVEIVGLTNGFVEIHEIGRSVTEEYNYCDVLPLLRPLSQLTTEIEVNGEKFVPIDRIKELFIDNKYKYCDAYEDAYDLLLQNEITVKTKVLMLPYEFVQKLLSWHFDIFGLLDKNLAEPIV